MEVLRIEKREVGHSDGARYLKTAFNNVEDAFRVFNNMEGAFLVLDSEGNLVCWNRYPEAFQYLVGGSLQAGESLIERIPKPWQPMAKSIIKRVTETQTTATIDVSCTDSRGENLFFELTCKHIADDEGSANQLLIEAKDITSQKIFEKKLSSVASDLSQLVENANAIVIRTDSRGYIIEWNEICSAVTGITKNEATAKKLSDILLEGSEKETFAKAFQSVVEGTPLINHELRVCVKDSRTLTFLININPNKNGSGQVVGALLIGQDITELVDYRNSLELKVNERTKALNESNILIGQQKEIVEKEQRKSENLLLNILPVEVARELKESGSVVPRRYQSASILFADLVGFTTLSKNLSPEELIRELNYMIVGFDIIAERNRLEKIKIIGDGYMAVAGIPAENKTNASDAVKAGMEMVEFVARIRKDNAAFNKPEWQMRVGINTGALVAGVIGKNKFAYDVWGASVNIASRMESAGSAGEVNISASTHELVKDDFECQTRGAIDVKGIGKMEMYFVKGRKKEQTSDESNQKAGTTPS